MRAAPRAASAWLSKPFKAVFDRQSLGALYLSQEVSVLVCSNMQRLKTRPQFQAVLSGKTLSRTTHFALHRVDLVSDVAAGMTPQAPLFSHACVWLGAMVPKRWAKRAVTRNAIKRQIYNVSALFEPHLVVGAHVVRLRAGFDRVQFVSATSEALKTAVRTELLSLFGRACPGTSTDRAKG